MICSIPVPSVWNSQQIQLSVSKFSLSCKALSFHPTDFFWLLIMRLIDILFCPRIYLFEFQGTWAKLTVWQAPYLSPRALSSQVAHWSVFSLAGIVVTLKFPLLQDHNRLPFPVTVIGLHVRFYFHCNIGISEDLLKHIYFKYIIISPLSPYWSSSINITGSIAGNLNCQKIAF